MLSGRKSDLRIQKDKIEKIIAMLDSAVEHPGPWIGAHDDPRATQVFLHGVSQTAAIFLEMKWNDLVTGLDREIDKYGVANTPRGLGFELEAIGLERPEIVKTMIRFHRDMYIALVSDET